ncbi:MAG: hypothetical protein ACR2QM_06720 [Longimicrobiales bacterium]
MVNRAEDILKAIIRWYLLEAICVVCLVVAAASPGLDRLWFGLTGFFAGTAAARLRLGDGSALGKLTRFTQGFVGVGSVLLGTALTGFGGILGWAGSYGILAALVLIPVGLGLVMMGVALAKVSFESTGRRPGSLTTG